MGFLDLFRRPSPVLYETWAAGRPVAPWTLWALPGHESPFTSHNLTWVTVQGRDAMVVRVAPGDAVYPGDQARQKERAEALWDPRTSGVSFGPGTRRWYRWSLLIPENFPKVNDPDFWTIAGQFHSQAAPDGEDPKTVPPIAVHLISTGIQLRYGIGSRINKVVSLPREKWVDLTLEVVWSRGADGYLSAVVACDGQEQRVGMTGPNLENDQPCMLRMGLYRGRNWTQPAEVAIGPVSVAKTRDGLR